MPKMMASHSRRKMCQCATRLKGFETRCRFERLMIFAALGGSQFQATGFTDGHDL